ncbi:hypothetical protein KIH41_13760 [Litoribacter ruber]|uniref:Uncharacterized protein n=1 Tax=Litoribacter ruber TaxID=702568 RepID=A0AAP2CHV1_9BACT|nr:MULTISPECIES: hypothetical protein [Litoribacter]MBS9522840.1 hypothetical protein [Litoribacter alkaliphilus]MBT0812347.1 hypothetical protein [Litoribacter ruber]
MKVLFLSLACLFCLEAAFAQHVLLLQRGTNKKTRIFYEVGEEITYRQTDADYFYTDVITEIQQDIIVMRENVLKPEQIAVVDIRHKDERNQTIRNLSTLAAGAGALWLTAETINSLYHDGRLSYSTGGLILSGALFATSGIISLTKYKYFKNQGRNRIQLIRQEPEDQID